MNKKTQTLTYIIIDVISAALGWLLLAMYFKWNFQSATSDILPAALQRFFYLGLVFVPFFWLILYYNSGYYNDVFRKSRLTEVWQTIGITFIGMIILFVLFRRIGDITDPRDSLFFTYFLIHFFITYIPRLAVTTNTTRRIHRGEIGFNTLIIGSNSKALGIYHEIKSQRRGSGNIFTGFVTVENKTANLLGQHLPCLGHVEHINKIIADHQVSEVIIAIESAENHSVNKIINKLIDTDVVIKAIPSMYDILTGKVKMNSILGTPLILVSHRLMPSWQEHVKNMLDFIVALLALVITLPLSLILIAGIKLTSPGPVFYSHERIGRFGRPFTIYKFRSMHVGAEKNGPELSSRNDERITPFGKFMRKTRFDEIPNFYNVLKGDMSLVGPRPERKYFIDKIIEIEPHYLHLLKVKPGITSWGQVKYGYAENVDQMIARLRYDMIYLDNMSLIVDFKILIYTILTIIKRDGK